MEFKRTVKNEVMEGSGIYLKMSFPRKREFYNSLR
jgi:hypothetical protein